MQICSPVLLSSHISPKHAHHLKQRKLFSLFWLTLISCSLPLVLKTPLAQAQTVSSTVNLLALSTTSSQRAVAQSDAATSRREFALPEPSSQPPVVTAAPAGQYVLEFNRSPVVGTRLRMEGIYDESRLRFTRPRNWEPKSVKVLLRFRHSGALYATRSNLTVLINGTSIGSVPLNQKQGEIGSVVFNVPLDVIQDYNEVVIAALQNNSPTCTQDPFDPSLWTEILPDSKLVFDFQPQPTALDFSHYPYPLFDTLSLDPNQIAYLSPDAIDESWLTALARFQTALGRIAEYRPLNTRLIESVEQVEESDRLIIIGTPKNQPALANLNLPLPLKDGQILDTEQKALPPDVGALIWTTTSDKRTPVLVATGNGPEGVAKAVQLLVQSQDQKISTGNVILVNQVTPVESPPDREWEGYLPLKDSFELQDLQTFDRQPLGDVTVRGSHSPALEFDFRSLPDDQFGSDNVMTLRYSYGPQVNPLTSLVEVQLDGVAIKGKLLGSVTGGNREALQIDLPGARIKPNSRMQINFRLDPRERRSCSRVTDQQLWGTVHADTSFKLNRENSARLPNLELLRAGFPFTAPQDLSKTAIVLPEKPSTADLLLLLEVTERLGRLSRAESVQLQVYRAEQIPPEVKRDRHLVVIGTQARFPLPEVFKAGGFKLWGMFSRQWQQSQIQTLPDEEGLVKQVISPWNSNRVLLALSSQTESGLNQIRDLFEVDSLFFQLRDDTVLVSVNQPNPSSYDANAYDLEFLRQSPQQEVADRDWSSWLLQLLRGNWFFLLPGIVAAAIILYGVIQLYLKRLTGQAK